MANGLADISVEINDRSIEIIPGSLEITKGQGDKTVRVQTAGGGVVDVVVTDNVETRKGRIKFSLSTTEANMRDVLSWQESANGNTARTFQGNVVSNFRAMHVITDPVWGFGADSTTDIVFEGPPAI